ncbi:MAG TPA: peroxiredoxin [Gammaproteobacteria bacterium]|nr:peroxiredoxin [Gammaproteobacteria bacterium]
MNKVNIGQPVPDFSVAATGGEFRLSDYRGRKVVLYFYPKASTPGCTQESQDFRDLAGEFAEAGAVIVGASRDSLRAQTNFKTKHEMPFELLADTDEQVCRLFDVIQEKNMYGRKVLGIVRSTFLIDGDGILRQEWRGVKVAGHAAAVLDAVKAL